MTQEDDDFRESRSTDTRMLVKPQTVSQFKAKLVTVEVKSATCSCSVVILSQ